MTVISNLPLQLVQGIYLYELIDNEGSDHVDGGGI
jgi:hypothetical protein